MPKVYYNENEVFDNDENHFVYRYEPVEYFKGNIENERFMFSAMDNWDDRLETRYLEYGTKITGKQVACLCFTTNAQKNAAAAWGMHKNGSRKTYVQIRYCLDELIKGLDGYSKSHDVDFYVRNVKYENNNTVVNKLRDLGKEDLSDEDFINLLCLKREDFSFEGEVRIIALGKDVSFKKKMFEVKMGEFIKNATCRLKLEPFSAKKVKRGVVPKIEKDKDVKELQKFVEKYSLQKMKSKDAKTCQKSEHFVQRCRLYEYSPKYDSKKYSK